MSGVLTVPAARGFAAAALWFAVATAHAQSPATCLVQRVEGTPTVVSSGSAAQRLVEPGLALGPNDTLRTPSASRVTLACPDKLTVVVGPDSAITVEGLLAGDGRPFGLRLLDGIAGFLFKGSSGVQVRTPSAVAAVRSTEWAMRVHDGVSEVFTRAGTVSVTADGGSARLAPGDGVDVSNAGELKPVVQWRPPRIARFAELLGPDW
jgi:ferric-dicitrate binding protein FerR (iron transport regulator)